MTFVYIDFHKAGRMTIRQVMHAIECIKLNHPDEQIYMDGDLYAIVGKKKVRA